MNATHRALRALAVVLLAGTAGRAAEAQSQPAIPEIRVGATVQGTITASDPAFSDRGRFKVYRFQAAEGERYIIDLRSDDFDAYLTVMRPVGGITEPLRSDDDGGEGTNARLRFRAPASGTYYLVAQSLGETGTGSFALTLDHQPPPSPVVARPVAIGATVRDRIADTDPILDEEDWEVYHHLYVIQGRAGQQLVVTMDSDDFDAYLSFGPLRGTEVEATDVDDDGGEGTNARLRVTLPRDGAYGIQARTFGIGSTGAYTLTVREYVPSPVTTRPIRPGQEVGSTLGERDADREHGQYYQHWTFTGRSGETVRIRMRSDDFDTYLFLGQMEGGAFQELAYNDDAGDGRTDSEIEFTLPAAGEYVIRASSYGAGATGEYTLRLDAPR